MDGLAYAYQLPRSVAQEKYMQERRAAIIEQRKQLSAGVNPDPDLERMLTGTTLTTSGAEGVYTHSRVNSSYGDMEHSRTSSSTSSSQSEAAHHSLLNQPFELRHGRRYLRELPYPLPVDLHELQRQNLRTLLSCRVFGKAVCCPSIENDVPKRVLEIGSGSAYWTTMCHEYFSSLGHKNVSFTGLDVAPLAPDLKKQGINWTFVQHDLRRIPFPFDDERFDLVMLKDMSLVMPLGMTSQKFIDESIRILRPGGILEIWETDHVVRSLASRPAVPTQNQSELKAAARSGTFVVSPGTPFAPAQNKYLQQANTWISEALDRRKLPPAPCARIAPVLHQEADTLTKFGARRVAVPLGELRWERDGSKHGRSPSNPHDSVIMPSKGKGKMTDPVPAGLTADQAALRHVALLTVLQMIENLEPILKEASGKNTEEWSHWWGLMMSDLLDPAKSNLGGECLEVGAWWATKIADE
ncbi:uncharacterized protein LTR77_003032 [Saxophila tyrrhenica]|uniref:Methyltransferase domain-containing protein n=1 Tax=Saxophila tyrrhenica TaxID=1690608 RepID=A0AAV9PJV9_9PEZI|nr:hypothetical protein LTR77_003032 [Saxophila tyrrhenica]